MNVKEQVREFIVDNFYVDDPSALSDDASLLEHGIVDSTGVLEVIAFIEDTFRLEVEEAEMLPENLDSIECIANFVRRKQRVAA